MATTITSSRRAKDLFGSCALVEIIHLHDCFRGALRALEIDVAELCVEISSIHTTAEEQFHKIIDLERRVAGRFTVIWSVFRAHSAAEDEFIWPALKAKQVSLPTADGTSSPRLEDPEPMPQQEQIPQQNDAEAPIIRQRERNNSITTVHKIEQEEYEEDHADEERMFNSINDLLSKLRVQLLQKGKASSSSSSSETMIKELMEASQSLLDGTKKLMHHLLTHLDKEETHCMPLVAQYLTKVEINDLVGKIMVSMRSC